MGILITGFVRLLKSLTHIFILADLKERIEALEAARDGDYIKLDKRLDARNAEVNAALGGVAERVSTLEGRMDERHRMARE